MASIKLKGATSGEITISSPSVAGTNTLELQATSGTLATTAQASVGTKNLIINGNMQIDQRNAGSAITGNGFMVDRWQNFQSQSSKWTSIQQVTDAPTGATHSVKYTSASAYTVGTSDYFTHEQHIEGFNIAHLNWGTSDAKTVTVSFYVKSSLTGTFGGALYSGSGSYGYPFEYDIDIASTWEKKTITIEGPTSGTFNTDNSTGFSLCFGLGIGTTYSWTAGSWQAQDVRSATGATSVVGTSGATWQITGVQLEVGTTATPFENLMYSQQLAMCQRYYYKISGTNFPYGAGFTNSSTAIRWHATFPVQMRTPPTSLETTGTASDYRILQAVAVTATSVPSFQSASETTFCGGANCSTASFSSNNGAILDSGGTAYLAWSAEL